MPRATFEIRAVGRVPASLLEDFQATSVSLDAEGSTIRVALGDEAELRGVLDALSRAGFLLIDVRREYG